MCQFIVYICGDDYIGLDYLMNNHGISRRDTDGYIYTKFARLREKYFLKCLKNLQNPARIVTVVNKNVCINYLGSNFICLVP